MRGVGVHTAPARPERAAAPGAGGWQGPATGVQGLRYRAIQAHQSQPGWAPPNVPALWARVQ